MRLHTTVLMVCMVLVFSISNLAISFEGVSAMPDRKVQGVCDVANATFPKGCTKTKLEEIKKSAALEYIALLENTVEARCIFWYGARQESIESVKANSTAFYPDEQLTSAKILSNSKAITDLTGVTAGLDLMEKNYMWPGYEDLVKKFLLDQRSKSKSYWEITDQFRLDWDALLISRAPIVWSQIKKAADTYNTSSSAIAKISSDAAAVAQAKQEKKDAADAATRKKNEAAANAQLAANREAALIAAQKKIKASGGCRIGNSNSWTENGYSYNFSEGSRKCTKGKWSEPIKTSPSGGSSSNNSKNRKLVNKTCDLRTGTTSSDWYGQSYSWTIWNNWSDGSRTIAIAGSGYANSVPSGC